MIIATAASDDAPGMTMVLNAIIARGGTTAHQTPYDTERMQLHYISPPELVCCHVAKQGGAVLGFQWVGWPNPEPPMPDGWAVIASFVAIEAAGQGIGQMLFKATQKAARKAGVKTIDATIRADNVPGLRYYGGLGFVDYARLIDVPLRDGTRVDRIRKRFDL
ncbi:GNAT family N-acetyltransferase [Loktanella sp. Alg231-35]|uniref:GNAT family N-acetyltransferase n=1 Tax=Loktanella sp. Alg231-35 TaxID=1922220 RepID=UPI000D55D819|nr:GNAT family N-acetyltransferase [Loktanella sp. Alg231-35]